MNPVRHELVTTDEYATELVEGDVTRVSRGELRRDETTGSECRVR